MRCDNGMKIFLWSNVLFVIRWIPILACCTCWTRIPVGGTFAWSKLCSSLYELWRLCTPATTKKIFTFYPYASQAQCYTTLLTFFIEEFDNSMTRLHFVSCHTKCYGRQCSIFCSNRRSNIQIWLIFSHFYNLSY